MISGFIASYEFDVREFLAWNMRDRVIGGKKSLLAHLCMITQMYMVVGVWELLGIDEI